MDRYYSVHLPEIALSFSALVDVDVVVKQADRNAGESA